MLPAYRLRDPALSFPFSWVTTAAGARWLHALVHQVPWDRCGMEQQYFPSMEAVKVANAGGPGLETQRPEMWYKGHVARVEALCHPS
jgi:hypothetical protein